LHGLFPSIIGQRRSLLYRSITSLVGLVNSGLAYLVGERGPEIFTPLSSGSITPNYLIGAGGGGGV
jgi:phage-related minor tail protein